MSLKDTNSNQEGPKKNVRSHTSSEKKNFNKCPLPLQPMPKAIQFNPDFQELERINDKLTQELQSALLFLESYKEKNEQLEIENDNLKAEMEQNEENRETEEMQTKMENLVQENSSLKSEIKNRQTEFQTFRKQANEEFKSHQDSIIKLEHSKALLLNEREDLLKKLESASINATLESPSFNPEEILNELQSSRNELRRLKEYLKEKDFELDDSTSRVQRLEEQLEAWKSKLKNSESQLYKKDLELYEATRSIDSTSRDISKLKREIENMKRESKENEEFIRGVVEKNQRKEEEIEVLKKDILKMSNEIDDSNRAFDHLMGQLCDITNEFGGVHEFETPYEACECINRMLFEYKKEIENLDKKLKGISTQREEFELNQEKTERNQIKDFELEKEKLIKLLKERENEINSFRKENSRIENELKMMNSTFDESIIKEKEKNIYKEKLSGTENQLKINTKLLEAYKSCVVSDDVRIILEELEIALSELILARKKDSNSASERIAEAKVEEVEKQLNKALDDEAPKANLISVLKKQNQSLKYQMKALKSELEVKRLLNRTTRNVKSGFNNTESIFNSKFLEKTKFTPKQSPLNKSSISRRNDDNSALSDELIENYIKQHAGGKGVIDHINFETFN